MKAAVVTSAGKPPAYIEFENPVFAPAETTLVTVTASALSHVTRSRASGSHYSAQDNFPFVAGIDGVGKTADGQRVYFVMPVGRFGGMAEQSLASNTRIVAIPDALDDVTAAAIAIPGMSSWTALKERAGFRRGETVLINGATGTSGRLAVQIAKHLGAKLVIATGRNVQKLGELAQLGADVLIPITEDTDTFETSAQPVFQNGVDIVLDYLWGPSAERLLIAAAKGGPEGMPLRFVQIGAASGGTISLPSAVLRSTAIQLMGSGIGSVPMERIVISIGEMLQAAPVAKLRASTRTVDLSQVEAEWSGEHGDVRTVFTVAR